MAAAARAEVVMEAVALVLVKEAVTVASMAAAVPMEVERAAAVTPVVVAGRREARGVKCIRHHTSRIRHHCSGT